MKDKNQPVTTKYAQAFVNVYGKQFTDFVIEQLKILIQDLVDKPTINIYLSLPLGPAYQKQCFEQLINAYNLPDYFMRLADLLMHHHRVRKFTTIVQKILKQYYKQNNIIQFTINSSHELKAHDVNHLKKFLESVTNKTVLSTLIINKQLIAGIRVQSTNYLWENSIRKRLKSAVQQITEEMV